MVRRLERKTDMQTETRQYKDVAGNPVTLDWLVKHEPEWAANQIRHRDKLDIENALLVKELAKAAGYLASVRTDRKKTDTDGNVWALQTMDWAEGAVEYAASANAALELHDDAKPSNDPSSATRPTGRVDCNSDAMAGFAAAHG